jgi:hypothetical protein
MGEIIELVFEHLKIHDFEATRHRDVEVREEVSDVSENAVASLRHTAVSQEV